LSLLSRNVTKKRGISMQVCQEGHVTLLQTAVQAV
jgi:hypothetical protein